jgi:hypothetical protein
MKIEVKPFNDHVRFVPTITFIRLKNRTGAAQPAHCFFKHHARRKHLTLTGRF